MALMPPSPTSPGGNNPGVDPLSLGAVTFRTNECPNELPFGAGHDIQVVSERVGGSRVVASFGAQPYSLDWSGTLWQPQLDERVQLLLAYMVAETEVLASWRSQQYYGKIKDFKPAWRNANRCSYRIEFEITRDANGAYSSTTQQTVDAQVAALLQGSGIVNNLLLNPPSTGSSPTSPGGASSDFQAPGASSSTVTPLPASSFQTALKSLTIAVNASQSVAGLTGAQLSTAVTAANAAVAAVSLYVASQNGASAAFLLGSRLLNMLTLVQRNIQRGQSPRQIEVAGQTLWSVASMYYGDYSVGFALAAFNRLPCPMLPSATSTTIDLLPGAA